MISNKYINKVFLISLWLTTGLFNIQVHSQDLEPRSLSSIPIGGNIAIISYSHSKGNIMVDSSLPIDDLNAKLNNMVFAYVKSFKLFNKLTKLSMVIPYSLGKYDAIVEGEDKEVDRNGFADPIIKISMILIGGKPLKPQDYFTQEPEKFKLGVSFKTKVPIGTYDPNYLLNVGTNRWSFQTRLSASYTIKKKIVFEGHFNYWLFTKNNNYYGGNTTLQNPLIGIQLHAAYIFKPGIWLALSTGKTFGGKLNVNGIEKDISQKNSRIGAAFSYKLGKHSGLKLAYTNGFSTRVGADFNTLALAYTYIWFDKQNKK